MSDTTVMFLKECDGFEFINPDVIIESYFTIMTSSLNEFEDFEKWANDDSSEKKINVKIDENYFNVKEEEKNDNNFQEKGKGSPQED